MALAPALKLNTGGKRQITNPGQPKAQPPPRTQPAALPGQPGVTQRPTQQQPQQPGAMMQNPAVIGQNMNAQPEELGGSGDPALDEYLNRHGNLLGGVRHPSGGFYLSGPFKGKTPGQMREMLTQSFRAGDQNPTGKPQFGSSMISPTGFTPDAEWKAKFQQGQIPRAGGAVQPTANPAAPAAASPGAVPPSPLVAPTATTPAAQPAPAVNPIKAQLQREGRLMADGSLPPDATKRYTQMPINPAYIDAEGTIAGIMKGGGGTHGITDEKGEYASGRTKQLRGAAAGPKVFTAPRNPMNPGKPTLDELA